MAAKNDILIDKDGNQIFPATIAEQVSYDGKINVKQAIKRGAVRNKVAPAVASMTDKEQIYVYTGTEEGYTFGNWYYWDGMAWTSGGAYNAIEVNTDGTLTEEGAPADAKATGDKLSELKDDLNNVANKTQFLRNYEVGFYNIENNEVLSNTTVGHCKFPKIQLVQGITYYFYGLFGYFCLITDENDTNPVRLTTNTQTEDFTGTYTAEKNGYIYISIKDSKKEDAMFCDGLLPSRRVVGKYQDTPEYVEPLKQLLNKQYIGTFTVGNYWQINPSDNKLFKAGTSETAIVDIPIRVYANKTYYYKDLFAYFCIFSEDGETAIERLTSNTSECVSGIYTPPVDGYIFISIIYSKNETAMFCDGACPDNYVSEGGFYTSVPYSIKNIETDVEMIKANSNNVYHVKKDGSGDYTSLTKAILKATETKNSKVYVGAGTFNLYDEFIEHYGSSFFDTYTRDSIEGIELKNGVELIFSANSFVVFNYLGTNENVHIRFSPFNAKLGDYIIRNLKIVASNCRYCVHDERGGIDEPYNHQYINCDMKLDNSAKPSPNVIPRQCIGGGLGKYGEILVENCVFESVGIENTDTSRGIVSWHNTYGSGGKSYITIKDNYFKGIGTFRFSWYGNSTEKSIAKVYGNHLGSSIVHCAELSSATTINTEVISWNNEITN